MNRRKPIQIACLCLLLLTLSLLFAGCASKQEASASISTTEDLNGRKMGCMSGSIFDQNIAESFPKSEIVYFSSRAELLLGLKSGKIDGFLSDEPVAMLFKAENDDVTYMDAAIGQVDYGICFSSDAAPKLEEFNEFLAEIKASGHLQELQKKWICPEGLEEKVPETKLTGENGTIRAVTTPDAAPFSFFKDQVYEGYEVEILTEFCEKYGYALQVDGTTFDALISSVASNKYDIAFNGIYITEERKKSVDFCDVTYTANVVPVIRKEGAAVKENFFESVKNSFRRTFVEEDRWQLILRGMGITLIITLLSMAFGTVLGYLTMFASRKSKAFKKFADGLSYIVAGLPVVLFLMILFYIIFAKASLSGTAISVIGFTIIECMTVYDMLKTGVSAIDNGQYEGALALGYTDTQAFTRIIVPQAIRIILPSYRKEIVTLIKATAIVGYVTVQDLTRVSDIIRSRTYDAFFPLIVTAVIYFLLAAVLTKLADKLIAKLFP